MSKNTLLDPPQNTADVDKRLRSYFLKNGTGLIVLLIVMPIAMIPIQVKLSHVFPKEFGYEAIGSRATTTPEAYFPGSNADYTRIFSSPPSIAIDILSAVLIMAVFWSGISKINKLLIGYARSFAERQQWIDVSSVLESFNQNGQHLLDTTGEAHYLLAISLERIDKPKAAQKARDYLLKRKGHTEWAQKLRSLEQARMAPLPSTRSRDQRPARSKRRRF
jgi:hypothetical protein